MNQPGSGFGQNTNGQNHQDNNVRGKDRKKDFRAQAYGAYSVNDSVDETSILPPIAPAPQQMPQEQQAGQLPQSPHNPYVQQEPHYHRAPQDPQQSYAQPYVQQESSAPSYPVFDAGTQQKSRAVPIMLGLISTVLAFAVGFLLIRYVFVGGGASGDDSVDIMRDSSASSSSGQSSAARTSSLSSVPSRTVSTPESTSPEEEPSSQARPSDPRLPSDAVAVNSAARSQSAGDLNAVWKSGPTSDDFALAVRDAFVEAYLGDRSFDQEVDVYSSVTGQSYTMRCSDNGEYVHCRGGNDANVYIA